VGTARPQTFDYQSKRANDLTESAWSEAARICGVSHRTIERLVETGRLKSAYNTLPAPPGKFPPHGFWGAEPVRSIVDRLLRTAS